MERICVVGLGYVGLPVAVELAKRGHDVIGFDINKDRIEELNRGYDRTAEISEEQLNAANARFSSAEADLDDRTFFIVTVPTPIDANKQPDLGAMRSASRTVGRNLEKGACVVFESTVYPGVTEEICGPILEKESGLHCGTDFTLGYSPERINPGDREHTLTKITKVVSGQDEATLERVAAVYESIVDAGVHRAPSIRVAEAAKVIENTQRDLNIALMNELAIIFDRLGIPTGDVLKAAGTKWNFLRFTPGLVGGHCIGVDPYYLTARAEQFGYHPEVILAGRRINDSMGGFVAQKLIKLLLQAKTEVISAKVVVLGITFKENVPDIRNSRVIDIVEELRQFGIEPHIVDPLAHAEEVQHEYNLTLTPVSDLGRYDAVVLAAPHAELVADFAGFAERHLTEKAVVVDVKGAIPRGSLPAGLNYWAL